MTWAKQQWQSRVRSLVANNSNIAWTEHARTQMQRRAISMDMASDTISKGSIHMEPGIDIRTNHIVCRMERFCAGKHLLACVALESPISTKCIVVTVMEKKVR